MTDKYISVTELRKKLYYIFRSFGMSERVKQAILNAIKKISSADVAPIVHGHWIEDKECGIQICSVCGEEHAWQDYRASYCEDCGAKMDGKDGEVK